MEEWGDQADKETKETLFTHNLRVIFVCMMRDLDSKQVLLKQFAGKTDTQNVLLRKTTAFKRFVKTKQGYGLFQQGGTNAANYVTPLYEPIGQILKFTAASQLGLQCLLAFMSMTSCKVEQYSTDVFTKAFFTPKFIDCFLVKPIFSLTSHLLKAYDSALVEQEQIVVGKLSPQEAFSKLTELDAAKGRANSKKEIFHDKCVKLKQNLFVAISHCLAISLLKGLKRFGLNPVVRESYVAEPESEASGDAREAEVRVETHEVRIENTSLLDRLSDESHLSGSEESREEEEKVITDGDLEKIPIMKKFMSSTSDVKRKCWMQMFGESPPDECVLTLSIGVLIYSYVHTVKNCISVHNRILSNPFLNPLSKMNDVFFSLNGVVSNKDYGLSVNDCMQLPPIESMIREEWSFLSYVKRFVSGPDRFENRKLRLSLGESMGYKSPEVVVAPKKMAVRKKKAPAVSGAKSSALAAASGVAPVSVTGVFPLIPFDNLQEFCEFLCVELVRLTKPRFSKVTNKLNEDNFQTAQLIFEALKLFIGKITVDKKRIATAVKKMKNDYSFHDSKDTLLLRQLGTNAVIYKHYNMFRQADKKQVQYYDSITKLEVADQMLLGANREAEKKSKEFESLLRAQCPPIKCNIDYHTFCKFSIICRFTCCYIFH